MKTTAIDRATAASREQRRPDSTCSITMRLSILILISVFCACSTNFDLLKRSAQIPALAPLQKNIELMTRTTFRVSVGEGGGGPIELALEHVGPEPAKREVVLIHGVLTDHTSWRFVAGELGMDHSLLLVDLLGCGRSSRPDPDTMGPDGYGPTAQARYVLEALRWRLANLSGSESIALVGHSLGGAVILRMLGDEQLSTDYKDVLDRVDRAVLLAPLDFAIEKVHPLFAQIIGLGATEADLAATFGILRSKVVRGSLNGVVDPELAPRKDAELLYEILRRKDLRRAAKAMIRQAVPFREDQRPDWERIEHLVADYRRVDVPTLILWGARDETFPVSMGYKLQAQLPQAWLRVFAQSMHSLSIERPRLCAHFIRTFIESGGDGWRARLEVEVADWRRSIAGEPGPITEGIRDSIPGPLVANPLLK